MPTATRANAVGDLSDFQPHPPRLGSVEPEQIECVTEENGFPTPLWTLKRIAEVIGKLTDVHYNSNYVWELLHQWNWSAQKPEAFAKERDEAEITRWQAEEWPRIKKGHKSGRPS